MIPKPTLSRSRIAIRWAWVCVLAGTIFVASGQGQVAAPRIVNFDKLAHFAVFGLLATLVARACPPGRRRWWAIFIVSLGGGCDEIRQSFTPGRSVEVADWVADTLGAITAVTVYQCWPAYRRLIEYRLGIRRRRTPTLDASPVVAERLSS